MSYIPTETNELGLTWIQGELYSISDSMTTQEVHKIHHVEPEKRQDGLVVLADGVDWDPLSLSGIIPYRALYFNGAWIGGIGAGAVSSGVKTVTSKAGGKLITPTAGSSIFVTSDDGGLFYAITGAAVSTYSDDSASYCGTVFIPTGGDGSTAWVRHDSSPLNVKWFGCVGDGAGGTDDSANIQSAWSIGGDIYFPDGDYFVTKSGLEALPGYGLIPVSGSSITFASNAWIVLEASVDVRHVIATVTGIENVKFLNPQIDCQDSASNAIGFNGSAKVSVIGGVIKNVTAGAQYPGTTTALGGGKGITFQYGCTESSIVDTTFNHCAIAVDIIGKKTNPNTNLSVSNIKATDCNMIIGSVGQDSLGEELTIDGFNTAMLTVDGVSFYNCGTSTGLDNRVNFSFIRQNSTGNCFPWMSPARTGTTFSTQDWLMATYSALDTEWSKAGSYTIGSRVKYTNTGQDSALFAFDHCSGISISNVRGYNTAAYGQIGALFRGLGKNIHISDVQVTAETKYIYRHGPVPCLSVTTRNYERGHDITIDSVVNLDATDYVIESDGPVNVTNPHSPVRTQITGVYIKETGNIGLVDSNIGTMTSADNHVWLEIYNEEKGGSFIGPVTQLYSRAITEVNTTWSGGYKKQLNHAQHLKVNASNTQLKLERTGTSAGSTELFGNNTGLNITTSVYLPNAAWNGSLLRLGGGRLWVDSTGDLRIKNGADPTSDTDGTVIGTQT